MANNNSAVHILFVCGMGMGTSTMAELGVKRNLVPLKITAELQHTSLGMMESLRDWADIIVKNLCKQITPRENEIIIPVVNIMDSKGIAAKIDEAVQAHFSYAKG